MRLIRSGARCAAVITIVLAWAGANSAAAQPSPKRATAVRIRGAAPHIDGRLGDAAWQGGAMVTDFEQQRPIEGAEPSERTEVVLRYDDEALYVGARMYRADPSQIFTAMTRRDGGGNAERLQVTIDPNRDRRTGYAFAVSAAGVRSDYHHSVDDENRGRENQYDPVWEAAAVVDSLGWTAEMRIPFSQIRFSAAEVQEWGFQMDRWMPDKNEDLQWIMIPTRETGYISRFGTLTGITGIRPRRPVETMPFIAADATRSAQAVAANPFRNPTRVRAGLDAKFGIGSNLTLDATAFPDFGQVEADPAEVNLSAFETIVEERRPFFTEGAQLLRVEGPNYFYSRRIGGPPHGSATGDYVDVPRAAPILGAAKLTGRTAARLSVGALLATTDRVVARGYVLDGARTTRDVVEPQTVSGVVRLLQEVGSQASTIGLALTGIRRDIGRTDTLRAVLAREAYAGGLDWRIRWKQGMYAVSGFAGFSHVLGDSLAIGRIQRSSAHYFQRPDGEYLGYDTRRGSLSGYTASIRADKDAGRHILWGAQLSTESPGYEVNDLGRLQSADDIDYNADIQVRETTPGRYLQNWRLGFVTRGSFNYGGNRTNEEWQQNTSVTFRNFWTLNLNTRFDLATLDDALTRGGPLMRTAFSRGHEIRLNSASGSRTSWRVNASWDRNAADAHHVTFGGGLTVRPVSRLQVSVDPTYQEGTDTRQYVAAIDEAAATTTYGRRYVFAHVDRVTVSMRTRVNYAFTPSFTLEGYGEPFVASGSYHDFGELAAPRTNDLVTYGTAGTTIARAADGTYAIGGRGASFTLSNRDFHVLSFRSNVVLRWEWAPGSTLFAVWQQNRRVNDALAGPVRPRDLASTTQAPGDNVFALKVSYWVPIRVGR
jgi:hypothetical protein